MNFKQKIALLQALSEISDEDAKNLSPIAQAIRAGSKKITFTPNLGLSGSYGASPETRAALPSVGLEGGHNAND